MASSWHSARLVSTILPSSVVTAIATGESWNVRRNRSTAMLRASSAVSRSWSEKASASAPNTVTAV